MAPSCRIRWRTRKHVRTISPQDLKDDPRYKPVRERPATVNCATFGPKNSEMTESASSLRKTRGMTPQSNDQTGTPPMDAHQLSAVQSLYVAERADGTGIYVTSMQLVAVMVTYAAVAFAVLGSELLSSATWVRGLIAVPLWGLAAYLVIMNALMAARVSSINFLETILREHAGPRLANGSLLASDAGDFASNLARQPWPLRLTSLISYLALLAGVLGLSAYSVASIWDEPWHWWLAALYAVLTLMVVGGLVYSQTPSFASKLNPGTASSVRGVE